MYTLTDLDFVVVGAGIVISAICSVIAYFNWKRNDESRNLHKTDQD